MKAKFVYVFYVCSWSYYGWLNGRSNHLELTYFAFLFMLFKMHRLLDNTSWFSLFSKLPKLACFCFVFWLKCSLQCSYIICMHICIALTVLSVDPTCLHATIGWLCTVPACYWSNYFWVIKYENNRKTKPKPIRFRQIRNPCQDMSGKR